MGGERANKKQLAIFVKIRIFRIMNYTGNLLSLTKRSMCIALRHYSVAAACHYIYREQVVR